MIELLVFCAFALLPGKQALAGERPPSLLAIQQPEMAPYRTVLPPWMSQHIHWKKMYPENLSTIGAFYSQDQEDSTAEKHFFHNMHGGVFLELGALDGQTLSNTKFFEESRGWRGILIEANHEEFGKLYENRPNAISMNAAICAQKQSMHFISKRSYIKEPGSAGPVGGIWELMSAPFRGQWYGSEDAMPEGAVLVPCAPLQAVLQMFGVRHIDFFSLDVEGAELEVLQTLDLSAVHINVIVVELDGRNPAKDEAVRQLLAVSNFERVELASLRNNWFANRHFKRSAVPA